MTNFITRIFPSKEVKAALGVIDEAAVIFDDNLSFPLVIGHVRSMILAQPEKFVSIIQKGQTPRAWVYSAIANVASDLAESGNYHLYRGMLNPIGPGGGLFKLYSAAVDELVHLGVVDESSAKEHKAQVAHNIGQVG